MSNRVPGLFIAGTDTGVGKTYVAALIAKQLAAEGKSVGVYKPAASGCQRVDGRLVSDDAAALWEAACRPAGLENVCPQLFEAPLAPHLAARAEGREIDSALLRRGIEFWRQRSEIVVVEGVGGLMSPMDDDEYVADLAVEFGYPLIVVSPNVLGTINQTLQTLITASVFQRSEGQSHFLGGRDNSCGETADAAKIGTAPCRLSVAGVVLNHPAPPSADDVSLSSNRRELAARCTSPILAEVKWQDEQIISAVDWFSLAR